MLVSLICHAQPKRFSFSRPKMGSPFTIIFYATDSTEAKAVVEGCFGLVDSLVAIFSDYADSSELNRLCARAGSNGRPFACSPALFDILLQSKYAWEKSGGQFDITLGPVTRLWRRARKEKQFPSPALVQEKLARTGFAKMVLNPDAHTVRLLQTGMQLDLGGIAQGYIAQQTMQYLQYRHIHNALVDASGDIVCSGMPPGTGGWTVAVNVPESKEELLARHLLLSNKAVTTSGDVYQYMEHGGKRYSHIINPATGYGLTSGRNVTVIADNGTLADWLTKACSILSIARAKQLANSMKAEVLIAEIKKGKLIFHMSDGFKSYWPVVK
ncbi:MAG: FAD:protein FMN transferase [Bacteroidota bacterium]